MIQQKLGKGISQGYVRQIIRITKKHLQEIEEDTELFTSAQEVLLLYLELLDVFKQEEQESYAYFIFQVIYEVIVADGIIHPKEEFFFQRICNSFHISAEYKQQIQNSAGTGEEAQSTKRNFDLQ